MTRIFFLAFDSAGQTPLIKKLRNAGHKVVVAQPRYPEFQEMLKQQQPPPEVVLADCSTTPSHTRETCNYIQASKAFQAIPIVMFNVKKEDEARTRERVPKAILLFNDKVDPELSKIANDAPDLTKRSL
jgi:CheY-like chemotaxis protein